MKMRSAEKSGNLSTQIRQFSPKFLVVLCRKSKDIVEPYEVDDKDSLQLLHLQSSSPDGTQSQQSFPPKYPAHQKCCTLLWSKISEIPSSMPGSTFRQEQLRSPQRP